MEPEPVAEPSPTPASEWPVRAAAQKAAQKKAEEAEAAAKKKAAGGKASAAALQKKLAAQKEAASAVEAAQKARIEELEAELLRQRVKMMGRWKCIETVDDTYVDPACADTYGCYRLYGHLLPSLNRLEHLARRPEELRRW